MWGGSSLLPPPSSRYPPTAYLLHPTSYLRDSPVIKCIIVCVDLLNTARACPIFGPLLQVIAWSSFSHEIHPHPTLPQPTRIFYSRTVNLKLIFKIHYNENYFQIYYTFCPISLEKIPSIIFILMIYIKKINLH